MFVPFVVLLPPFRAGWLSAGALFRGPGIRLQELVLFSGSSVPC
jgi:hypothetical protein